jgi:hypothetical protein
MRLFLTAIILMLLGQPAAAGCDFSQPDGFCKPDAGGWIQFTTGEGRFLSEAYCYALGELAHVVVEIDDMIENGSRSGVNTGREGKNDTITTVVPELPATISSKYEVKLCDLHVVGDELFEITTSADGSETEIFEETVIISRGISSLKCGMKSAFSPEGDVVVEIFDESQNFYADLIHPANSPTCGPSEKFRILESKEEDGGEYWSVKIGYRSNG